MKVLLVPHKTGLAHTIPLVALDRMLRDRGVETAFLIAPSLREAVRLSNVRVLPVEYRGTLQAELSAYREFAPDVVIDDCSPTTGYATTIWGVPRIAIQRTGVFPFQEPRNPAHRHSLPSAQEPIPDLARWGLAPPHTLSDLFQARVKIVPGIRSVELLPEPVRSDPSYFFSGPLIVEDYLWGRPGTAPLQGDPRDFSSLDRFFAENRDRDVVYFTHGLEAPPADEVIECIRLLLDGGHAVVTSIPSPELVSRYGGRLYHARYLPMHHVCSRVKLAVHHCGSATYQYPLLHGIPSITIGTQSYDRDDVAARLDELGAAKHLPSPLECSDFVERFREAFRECFEDSGRVYRERQARVAELREEIRRTAAEFDIGKVLSAAAGDRVAGVGLPLGTEGGAALSRAATPQPGTSTRP